MKLFIMYLKSNRRRQTSISQSTYDTNFFKTCCLIKRLSQFPWLGSPSGSQLRALSPVEHVAALQPHDLEHYGNLHISNAKVLKAISSGEKSAHAAAPPWALNKNTCTLHASDIFSTQEIRNPHCHLVEVLLASCQLPCSASLHPSGNLLQTLFKSRLPSKAVGKELLVLVYSVCLLGLPKNTRRHDIWNAIHTYTHLLTAQSLKNLCMCNMVYKYLYKD